MPASAQLLLIVSAILAGSCVAVQQVLNAALRIDLGSAFWAALISYIGGAVALLAGMLVMHEPWPALSAITRSSTWSWAGGFFGACYIFTSIMLVPRLGAMMTIALLISGQLLGSLILDHFGLFGLTQRSFDVHRAAGVVFLIVGILLIRGWS